MILISIWNSTLLLYVLLNLGIKSSHKLRNGGKYIDERLLRARASQGHVSRESGQSFHELKFLKSAEGCSTMGKFREESLRI